jgi:hypothetical protein
VDCERKKSGFELGRRWSPGGAEPSRQATETEAGMVSQRGLGDGEARAGGARSLPPHLRRRRAKEKQKESRPSCVQVLLGGCAGRSPPQVNRGDESEPWMIEAKT